MSCESSIADLTMEMFEEEDCREQLLSHIKELHEAVVDMKSAFTAAQLQLQSVQGDDDNLKGEIESTKTQCEKQSSDILNLLLSLKGEVGSIKEALQSTQLVQHGLQSSVQTLVLERDLLLDELAKNGAISENIRGRLHSRLNGFARPSSGSQSTNDSGVALLLEKAHAAFQPIQNSLLGHHHHHHNHNGANGSPNENDSTGNNNSVSSSGFGGLLFGSQGSGDSLSDPHLVSPHVQEYLNNLSPHPPPPTHNSQHHHNNHHHHHPNDRTQLINAGDPSAYSSYSTTEEVANGVVYDSDCSLTLAATKSLSLSNSLSKQCGLELDQEDKKNRSRHESHTGISHLADIDSSDSVTSSEDSDMVEEENETTHQRGNGQPGYISDGEFGTEGKSGPMSFKEGQRLKVAKELLETERKYCNTLKTIQETFAHPLKNLGVLSMKDINTLFPEEVFDLHEKHCGLLAQLEERIASWKGQPTIGDLLERFTNGRGSDVLRLYTSYVNDFPEVLKTFHKLCRSSREFTQFLKSSLEHPACGGLDLGAFLLSPVQRMPRYILLLKQMIKYTEPSHPDYKDITTCLDRLRDYLKRLNDSMEHSFQLVTAQITPQPDEDKGMMMGFGSKNGYPRASVSSSHSSTGGEEIVHKVRYKRSTSVPRNQIDSTSSCSGKESKGKLKSRSKSDWTVCSNNDSGNKGRRCQACNCGQPPSDHDSRMEHSSRRDHNSRGYSQPKSKPFERTLSDSDINSDGDDGSLVAEEKGDGRKFSTSKSLHDFNHDDGRADWFISEPSLCDGNKVTVEKNRKANECHYDTVMRNNVMVRPLTSAQPGRYVARIQRGSESDMNLHLIGGDHERGHKHKKMSLRTSLKNIFSLKKRTTRTLQISGPILPSKPGIPSSTPPPVATLSYNTSSSREGHQSLPPDHMHRRSFEESDESVAASLPPVQTTSRYVKNPCSKLTNPKLPKTPFMTKYCAHNNSRVDERGSPFTDV